MFYPGRIPQGENREKGKAIIEETMAENSLESLRILSKINKKISTPRDIIVSYKLQIKRS